MKILYVMPGFDEGGAEIHVLNLIREMSSQHEITLISHGGRLEAELPQSVRVIHMPSHLKTPATIIYCAVKIALLNREYHWDIIHAHSRVPAWVSWIAARLSGVKWVVTAHALYSLNFGIVPLKHSDGAVAISQAVYHHLSEYLPDNAIIIPNGIIPPKIYHRDFQHNEMKFLIAGRLTRLKGVDVALNALAKLQGYEWTLDVVGEGPERENLAALSAELGISERVKFHGDKGKIDVEKFMASSSYLLFPSKSEGQGLVVLEALSAGLPVIASDLEALRDFADGDLIAPGDVSEWRKAIEAFILTGKSSALNAGNIMTVSEMSAKTEKYYMEVL